MKYQNGIMRKTGLIHQFTITRNCLEIFRKLWNFPVNWFHYYELSGIFINSWDLNLIENGIHYGSFLDIFRNIQK